LRVARGDAVALTRELVRIDSRNPSLVAGGPGEGEVARMLGEVLESWGFRVGLREAAPGRPNVIARIGTPGARSLMFNGHVDVVGVEGMTHSPWSAEVRDGRLFGRGSSDMKGGVAAMCAAAVRAAGEATSGEIVVAAVVDEEFASIGTRAIITDGVRADAAIVAEPTGLAIMPAHKGFVWIDVTVRGRAAHGSRWDIGIDAIRHAGLILAELDHLDADLLPRRSHPLLGRPSVHASVIEGGSGMSTYPEQCVLRIERRTLPGETPDQVRAEIEDACRRARSRRAELDATVVVSLAQAASDVSVDAPIVRVLSQSVRDRGLPVHIAGMSAWTDAALLNEAGIPAICFGPGDMGLAHAAEEFIDTAQIEPATEVLTRLAAAWCGGRGDAWPS
jgi:acetylornithine deacetylase